MKSQKKYVNNYYEEQGYDDSYQVFNQRNKGYGQVTC